MPSTARSMMAGWVSLVLTGACRIGNGLGGFKAYFVHSYVRGRGTSAAVRRARARRRTRGEHASALAAARKRLCYARPWRWREVKKAYLALPTYLPGGCGLRRKSFVPLANFVHFDVARTPHLKSPYAYRKIAVIKSLPDLPAFSPPNSTGEQRDAGLVCLL